MIHKIEIIIYVSISMEQVMNNLDIIRLIYSFGYPNHRIYMKQIVDTFKDEQANREFNMECIIDDWNLYHQSKYYLSSMNILLSDLFNRSQQTILLVQMIKCKCCTRHCHNKPFILNGNIIYKPNRIKYTMYDCNCNCRHISRELFKCYKKNSGLHRLKESVIYRSPTEIYY
jgi:hypothetical protein